MDDKNQENKEILHDEKKSKKYEKLEKEIEKLSTEVAYWKNEYYRAYADTKNLRNSLEKDHADAIKYRAEGFIEELLPILDSFQVVLSNEPSDPNLKNYLVGFQYIYRNLLMVLENEGVKAIAPKVGDKFDPKTMNAVESVEDDENPDTIHQVHSNGYMLHDRLVRPANVVVGVKKQKEEQKFDA